MRRLLLLVRFLAGACIVSWILFVPLSFLGRGYAAALRGGTNVAVQGLGSTYSVHVKPRKAGLEKDCAIVVKSQSRRTVLRPFSSWYTGYLPTVCGVALALATPIAWRRRARAAALVALLVQGFVAARIALLVIQILLADPALHEELPGFLSSPATHGLLVRMTNLDREASLFLLVPLGIWAVVTLRVEDLERLWSGAAPPAANPSAEE